MGQNPTARRVLAPLDVLPFPGLLEARAAVPCLHCSSPLTLHQPDPESPDRLLGVCEGCKHWYLVDLLPGQAAGCLVGLPGDEVVRELAREDSDEGNSPMGEEPDPGPIRKPGK
jgi:hypothetical protein